MDFAQGVWTQYALREAQARPMACYVSAALANFATLFQRQPQGRDDLACVFRLADCLSVVGGTPTTERGAPAAGVSGGITACAGVSAAELLRVTPDRVPEVLGHVVLLYTHPHFHDKQHRDWGYAVRQLYQPAHTKRITEQDGQFLQWIEQEGPVPTHGIGAFFAKKWRTVPVEHPEWTYATSDNLRRRYQRLKARLASSGLGP